jgi:hypothetical protein
MPENHEVKQNYIVTIHVYLITKIRCFSSSGSFHLKYVKEFPFNIWTRALPWGPRCVSRDNFFKTEVEIEFCSRRRLHSTAVTRRRERICAGWSSRKKKERKDTSHDETTFVLWRNLKEKIGHGHSEKTGYGGGVQNPKPIKRRRRFIRLRNLLLDVHLLENIFRPLYFS